jgi:hypothetical protein
VIYVKAWTTSHVIAKPLPLVTVDERLKLPRHFHARLPRLNYRKFCMIAAFFTARQDLRTALHDASLGVITTLDDSRHDKLRRVMEALESNARLT